LRVVCGVITPTVKKPVWYEVFGPVRITWRDLSIGKLREYRVGGGCRVDSVLRCWAVVNALTKLS
jgi:hypothetical protein